MLVLTRKSQQKIRVGENITITILRVKGQSVRVGIEAPRDVHVVRGELPPKSEVTGEPETEVIETFEIKTSPEVKSSSIRTSAETNAAKTPPHGKNVQSRFDKEQTAKPISHQGLKSQVSARRVRAVRRLNGDPIDPLRRDTLLPLRSTLGYH